VLENRRKKPLNGVLFLGLVLFFSSLACNSPLRRSFESENRHFEVVAMPILSPSIFTAKTARSSRNEKKDKNKFSSFFCTFKNKKLILKKIILKKSRKSYFDFLTQNNDFWHVNFGYPKSKACF
jgi:hypothetical protein